MKITLVNSGGQLAYLQGLVSGLSKIKDIHINILDSSQSIGVFDHLENVTLYDIISINNANTTLIRKSVNVCRFYLKLFFYIARTKDKIFHVQWYGRFYVFDRIVLNSFYKICGKKIIFTAHNINKGERDGRISFFQSISLKLLYNVVDVIIVHTRIMKDELVDLYGVGEEKVFVVPHGINNFVDFTSIDRTKSRGFLNIDNDKKVILFFGRIDKYKGLDILIEAFQFLDKDNYTLVIAGSVVKEYLDEFRKKIEPLLCNKSIIARTEYIKNEDIEYYFKGADCLVLPYRRIYQSGVIFLSYQFGLPIVASDVGSLKEDIIEFRTGYICRPEDPFDLAGKIKNYFDSSLYANLESTKVDLRAWANKKYSWDSIGEKTYRIYERHTADS